MIITTQKTLEHAVFEWEKNKKRWIDIFMVQQQPNISKKENILVLVLSVFLQIGA